MGNKTALVIGLLIVGIFAADLLYFGWDLHITLAKRFIQLSEKLAFWR